MRAVLSILVISLSAVPIHGQIKEIELNPDVQHVIYSHPARTTTLQFPYPIEGVDGMGFVFDPVTQAGEYMISHTAGSTFLSIVPIDGNAPPRNLNIIVNGMVIAVAPAITASPTDAYSVVRFIDPLLEEQRVLAEEMKRMEQQRRIAQVRAMAAQWQSGEEPATQGTQGAPEDNRQVGQKSGGVLSPDEFGDIRESNGTVKRSDEPPPPRKPLNSTQMLGILDTTKLLAGLDEKRMAATVRAMPHVVVSVREDDIMDYGPYRVYLDRVIRIDKHDALGFAVRVENQMDKPLRLDPEGFLVRSGAYVYPVVIADVPLTISPDATATGYLLVVGSINGRRNNLAADGNFRIVMRTVQDADDFAAAIRGGDEQ